MLYIKKVFFKTLVETLPKGYVPKIVTAVKFMTKPQRVLNSGLVSPIFAWKALPVKQCSGQQGRGFGCTSEFRRYFSLLIFVLICWVGCGYKALAETSLADVYTIRELRIDQVANTEVLAKQVGIATAKSTALKKLMARLVKNPEQVDLTAFSGQKIELLIRDISISREKFGGGRYLGDLTVRFNPEAIQNFLDAQNIPYSENAPKPLVVVPVLKKDGRTLLWDIDNSWQQAWGKISIPSSLLSFRVPLGDLDDVFALNVEQVIARDETALSALVSRYDGSGFVIATLNLAEDPEKSQFTISPSMYIKAKGWVESRAMSTQKGSDLTNLLQTLASNMVATLQADWKGKTQYSRRSGLSEMAITIAVQNLAEWLQIRQSLMSVPIVLRSEINRVNLRFVQILIEYAGTDMQLKLALSQQGLALAYDRSKAEWTLNKE